MNSFVCLNVQSKWLGPLQHINCLNLLNQIRDADEVKFESASVLAQMYEQQVNMIGSELCMNYH
jgi:hypothetical protein